MKVNCQMCNTEFEKLNHEIKRTTLHFCSLKCHGKNKQNSIEFLCSFCGNKLKRIPFEIKKSKSGNHFCSRSCSVSFNNKLKRKSNRSKCEIQLFEMLKKEFSDLEILPNDKTMLDGYEVDIAIPSLKLAIEWNGIVHFKPIYGEEKLHKTQIIDSKKLEMSNNKNINLIVISDLTSTHKMIQEAFLNISSIIKNLRGK